MNIFLVVVCIYIGIGMSFICVLVAHKYIKCKIKDVEIKVKTEDLLLTMFFWPIIAAEIFVQSPVWLGKFFGFIIYNIMMKIKLNKNMKTIITEYKEGSNK